MSFWSVAQNILPTRRNLLRRDMTKNLAWVHYGYHVKNDRHALFDCVFAKKVWNYLHFGDKWHRITTLIFLDLVHSILLQYDPEVVALFPLVHVLFGCSK